MYQLVQDFATIQKYFPIPWHHRTPAPWKAPIFVPPRGTSGCVMYCKRWCPSRDTDTPSDCGIELSRDDHQWLLYVIYKGVSTVMGVPQNGWFIRENPNLKWMITWLESFCVTNLPRSALGLGSLARNWKMIPAFCFACSFPIEQLRYAR